MTYRPAPEIIGDIVQRVRANFSEENILPYYDFGVPNEVVNRLKVKTESLAFYDKKYPLIWYMIDGSIKESTDARMASKRLIENISIIICAETDAERSSQERFNSNFIPTLRPLYESFISELKKSNLVRSTNNYKHSYYENLFWGRDGLYGHTGNIFDDRLDAIIIDGLDLLLIENC